jgi:hypothetical protein
MHYEVRQKEAPLHGDGAGSALARDIVSAIHEEW